MRLEGEVRLCGEGCARVRGEACLCARGVCAGEGRCAPDESARVRGGARVSGDVCVRCVHL